MTQKSFFNQLSSKEKYILICCFFIFAVNGLYAMILGSILPLISDAYHLNDTQSGLLISAHQIGNLIAGFIAGILPIYLGRKKAIIFLSSFVIVGFTIMLITGNPILLILGFLFTGLSRGSISNFNNTVVNEVSNSSPKALNILHSVFAVGALLAPFLVIASTHISELNGWKISIIVIILLILISIFLFSKMEFDEPKSKDIIRKKLSYVFLKKMSFWHIAMIFFLYLCAEAALNGFLVKYFVDSNIMSITYAQMLASLLWLVMLVGRIATALLSDFIPRKLMVLIMSISTVLFYALLLSTKNLTLITLAISGLGLSMAGIYPSMVALAGKTIKIYPMSMGVLLALGGLGAILMPIITGSLSDYYGIYAGMSAIIVALITMVTLVIVLLIKKEQVQTS